VIEMRRPITKKVGEVTVLRFTREPYNPPRKFSPTRFLRRAKTLVPCQAPTITADELEKLILNTFGTQYQYFVAISDEWFRLIKYEDMVNLLKEDDTDTIPYVDTVFDCDDFSDVLLGSLTRKTWNQGYAIGNLWYINEELNFGHAVNLFVDDQRRMWIIEPQNDKIIQWGSTKEYSGKAYLVKL
jgi:hypothetical protein